MARYVKVLIDKGVNQWGHNGLLSISELRAFDSKNENIALSKPATASSNEPGAAYADAVTDGITGYNGNQEWVTKTGSGLEPLGKEWVKIDLQKNYYISKIELVSTHERGVGCITDYRIMFSNDDETYNLAAQIKNAATPPKSRTDTITDIKNIESCLYLKNNTIYGMQPAQ